MDDKKARELLIKSGLSENKAKEVSGHLAREFNKEQEHHKKKEIDVNEVVVRSNKKGFVNNYDDKNLSEVITKE